MDGVTVVYAGTGRSVKALENVDLDVRRGEFVSVIGPSGCGKSTLLRVIGGLQNPTFGTISIDGRLPQFAKRTKDIGLVFQDPSLLPWRTAVANVALPLEVNKSRPGMEPRDLLDLVGLRGFETFYPHQLSGGMQQRVAIARALVTSPSLLLMDEPFGALDEITRSAMRYELMRVWDASDSLPRTVVFVTHSIAEAVLLSDRVLVLSPRPGRVTAALEVGLPRPRDEATESTAQFIEYTAQLRSLLRARAAA